MWSKKRLLEQLRANGFIEEDNQVGYEAFGRKVCAFIRVISIEARWNLEAFLIKNGQKVNVNYWPGHPVTEVQVTYFKAWHWDE